MATLALNRNSRASLILDYRHEGAVWSISWAHPKYGNILASSSYDGKVFIWRETNNQWAKIFDFALHTASVNIISWSPHDSGCLLACASSDGYVSVLEYVIFRSSLPVTHLDNEIAEILIIGPASSPDKQRD